MPQTHSRMKLLPKQVNIFLWSCGRCYICKSQNYFNLKNWSIITCKSSLTRLCWMWDGRGSYNEPKHIKYKQSHYFNIYIKFGILIFTILIYSHKHINYLYHLETSSIFVKTIYEQFQALTYSYYQFKKINNQLPCL